MLLPYFWHAIYVVLSLPSCTPYNIASYVWAVSCKNCKLHRHISYCSFSYSPRFIFLTTFMVSRSVRVYITDRSDSPISSPTFSASAVVNFCTKPSNNIFYSGFMLTMAMYF